VTFSQPAITRLERRCTRTRSLNVQAPRCRTTNRGRSPEGKAAQGKTLGVLLVLPAVSVADRRGGKFEGHLGGGPRRVRLSLYAAASRVSVRIWRLHSRAIPVGPVTARAAHTTSGGASVLNLKTTWALVQPDVELREFVLGEGKHELKSRPLRLQRFDLRAER